MSRLKLYSFESASSIAYENDDLSLHDCQPMTAMAPSIILSDLSGIIKSSENSILNPSPAHTGHAPNGLLNEKLLGSNSGTAI